MTKNMGVPAGGGYGLPRRQSRLAMTEGMEAPVDGKAVPYGDMSGEFYKILLDFVLFLGNNTKC